MAHEELREFFKDSADLLIGLLPLATVLSFSRFIHKWVFKKRVVHRLHHHIKRQMRIRRFKRVRIGTKILH
jgi:hypothetical protein